MSKIVDIKAWEILDSRGNPTINVRVVLNNKLFACASTPSGASKGKHEALEIRDKDMSRFHGKGVLSVVENINKKIRPALLGKDAREQRKIDQIMLDIDGTDNKRNLGANGITAVSLAVARSAALYLGVELYKYIMTLYGEVLEIQTVTPLFNVINGGLHGTGELDFQEFLLIPDKSKSFSKSLRIGTELYHKLKAYLKKNQYYYAVGDEGGFTPNLPSNKKALNIIKDVIQKSQYEYCKDVYLGLDLAATNFYRDKYYKIKESKDTLRVDDFIKYLKLIVSEFNILLLEDPLYEDDWNGWIKLTKEIGEKTLIVGDDLLVTNINRLKKAVELTACNSILVKVNQIGTLTETLDVIKFAKKKNFKIIVSHRSGETNDDFIADLAVGVRADYVKFGAPARGERVAKYNRLIEIFQEIE